MQTKKLIISLALGSFLFASCSNMNRTASSSPAPQPGTAMNQPQSWATPEVLARYTGGWPEESQRSAKDLLEKYGQPTESTASMLIWRNTPPFKRVTVTKEEVTHKFPILHKDVVEHVVNYKIPVEKADELVKFDGSIVFDRTRGELSARGDNEAMNILALNLASEILEGKKTAEQARNEFGRIAVEFINGNRTAYTEGLQFGGQINTADADQSIKLNWAQAQEAQPQNSREKVLKQSQEEMAE